MAPHADGQPTCFIHTLARPLTWIRKLFTNQTRVQMGLRCTPGGGRTSGPGGHSLSGVHQQFPRESSCSSGTPWPPSFPGCLESLSLLLTQGWAIFQHKVLRGLE